MFSPGAYINNRSLMPCQEPPIAMSTWQAAIHVPKGCTVLMSGDELPVQNCDETDVGMVCVVLKIFVFATCLRTFVSGKLSFFYIQQVEDRARPEETELL